MQTAKRKSYKDNNKFNKHGQEISCPFRLRFVCLLFCYFGKRNFGHFSKIVEYNIIIEACFG